MPVPDNTLNNLFSISHSSNAFSGNDFYHYWNGGIPETIAVYDTEEPASPEPASEGVEQKISNKK